MTKRRQRADGGVGALHRRSWRRRALVNIGVLVAVLGGREVAGQVDASTFAMESNTGSLADLYDFIRVTT